MNNKNSKLLLVEELIRYHFTDALQSGYLSYRNDCRDYFLHYSEELEKTKRELSKGIADPTEGKRKPLGLFGNI